MGKIWLTRRGLLSLLPAAALVAPASAEIPLGVPSLYAADPLTGLALRGYDPVSYRLGSEPVSGSDAHDYVWSGLVWRFASAANRGAFARAPEVYAPRLGGCDPEGIVAGRLVEADPLMASLYGDRLYLFRDAERRRRAGPELLDAAEARWPDLRRDAAIGG
ncbi:YHS domain-containing (seleno)protein [Methylobacterium indicum]|uniref:YHS domain-containing (seleno)protein n=1 Tax=Methylobacterium indicum TaxID=1775910 RepID=UPI00243551CA|nr:YHS domain-containing (seleno)protein [Methylobacterium indicum]